MSRGGRSMTSTQQTHSNPSMLDRLPSSLGSAFKIGGQDWNSILGVAVVVGLAVTIGFGFASGSTSNAAAALMLSGASLVIGVLLGFLFGIPRSLQVESPPAANGGSAGSATQETQEQQNQYRPNTNL